MASIDPAARQLFRRVLDRYVEHFEQQYGQHSADVMLGGMLLAARLLSNPEIGPVAFAALLTDETTNPRIVATAKSFQEAFDALVASMAEEGPLGC